METALQSAHVYRCRTGNADWADVVQLYGALFALTSSPLVALIALWPSLNYTAPLPALTRCQIRRLTHGYPNISLIGPHEPNFWLRLVRTTKLATLTKLLSGWSATPPCASFCSSDKPRWRHRVSPNALRVWEAVDADCSDDLTYALAALRALGRAGSPVAASSTSPPFSFAMSASNRPLSADFGFV